MRIRDGFFAPTPIGQSRRMTPEGYLVCEGVRIARTGNQRYHESEFKGQLRGDISGEIIVNRPDEEVFRKETLESFQGKPITIEHPGEFVGPDSWNRHAVGTVQNPRRGNGTDRDCIIADLLITESGAIRYVNANLPELSAGYNADYDQDKPGYASQRNIVGNHVALVEKGRAGSRVAINDSLTSDAVRRRQIVRGRYTGDFTKPMSIENLNSRNRQFWAKHK
jgi:hypothetical protein